MLCEVLKPIEKTQDTKHTSSQCSCDDTLAIYGLVCLSLITYYLSPFDTSMNSAQAGSGRRLSLVTCHLFLVTLRHFDELSASRLRAALVTCYLSLVTCHLLLVTCYLSLVTCHLLLVTYHLPLVNRIESCVFNQCIRYSYSCFGLVVFE
jgi:hypothetical protein